MAKQPRAEFNIDAAGGVAEHISAQHGQHALEQHDDGQADYQNIQGRRSLVRQHLVHHDLEEQRADQREELQEE